MAFGALSSLGLGSQGILTNDILDKLKAADKASMVNPITRRKFQMQNRSDELSNIKSKLNSLSSSITTLLDDDIYSATKINSSGDSVAVSSTSTTKAQNFTINVKQLATRDIFESKDGFSSKDSQLESGSITIQVGDNDSVSIDINDGDTIEDLVDNINEQLGDDVEASLLNVGGDNPYRLIIKSKNTGEANSLTISSDSASFSSGIDRIGDGAKDAIVEIDGIEVKRGSNKFDDVIDGVEFTAKKSGETTVSIEEDRSKFMDSISDFVDQFNSVINTLKNDTRYNADTKSAGVFQGNSTVRGIIDKLQNIVYSTISSDGKMAMDFGLEIKRDGTLSLDKSKLENTMKENPDQVKEFFKSKDTTSGLFQKFDKTIFRMTTFSGGDIKNLSNSIESSLKSLEEMEKNALARLEAKYDIMAKQFASFDSLMGTLNSSATTLKQMIDAQFAKK